MIRKTSSAPVAALVIAMGLALAGCSTDSSSSASEPDEAVGADTSAIVEAADAQIEQFISADRPFPTPAEPFTSTAGTATVIAQGSSAAAPQLNAERAVDAFETLGWEVKGPLDGKFSAPVVGGFLDAAVQEQRDAVVLVSVTLADVGQSVKNALDSGLAISCVMCSFDQEMADEGVMYATIDFEKQGEILGWYFIQASNGSGKIASVKDPAVGATTMRADGLTRVVQENCSTCEVLEDIVIPSSDIALPGPPQWSAFLNSHGAGSVDYINVMADVVGVPMAKTLMNIGRDDIKLGGFDADVEAVDMIRAGDKPFVGTVALPYYWASWAAVDLVARQTAGVETWDASDLPLQLVTLDSVNTFDEFVPAGDWQGEFKKLWNVS